MVTRRQFLKGAAASGAVLYINGIGVLPRALAAPAEPGLGLSDPAMQPMFETSAPNALDPGFIFQSPNNRYRVPVKQLTQHTGLVDPQGNGVPTTVWGYGTNAPGGTWPGMTFVAHKDVPVEVVWQNKLPRQSHLLPVDTSLHWAYSLPGYERYSIEKDGPPIVTHLHGGHTDFEYDGNPEFFFAPGFRVKGPQWVGPVYRYDNDQPAGTLWYHDHALGITRLNVYAGLAGFYILRDEFDTGMFGNDLDLPAHPYEVALAIQDRMFTTDGSLFYPAFDGDPFYEGFIKDEGAYPLPEKYFPTNGGPTALAEFFGDHMLVNGQIWPKMEVEPRNYRLRLLNGCDSRFLAVELYEVPADAKDFSDALKQLDFTVIGSDQGLASQPTTVKRLLIETGARYDVVVDFKQVTYGHRVIMKNIGGNDPFSGEFTEILDPTKPFGQMDRIMAFDVIKSFDSSVADASPAELGFGPDVPTYVDRIRKVALFEGKDEFDRLQPLLGTAEPATDYRGMPILWPDTDIYKDAGLVGQMEGSIGWHSPTTENPALDHTEEWEIWNVTGDAHPVHLHLVHFEILGREEIKWDSNTLQDDRVIPNADFFEPRGDGTYLAEQPVVQHNGLLGKGFRIVTPGSGPAFNAPSEYVENAPKDMVTALPGQITRIKAHFDKPGRYVWHCHILSHEDHEMMRVLHVGPGA